MTWNDGIWAVLPTLCIALLFWFVMRSILRSDRTERAAQAMYEAEYEAEAGADVRLLRRATEHEDR